MPRLFWCCLLVCYCCLGTVQAQRFHVSHYTTDQGLPSNHIRHVITDSLGYLWVASDKGLTRFDGQQFKSYSGHVPSLYGQSFCLAPNGEGILHSHDAGISWIRPALDTAKIELWQGSSIDADADQMYFPRQLFRQQDGSIWIAQSDGQVSRYREGEWSHYHLPDVTKGSTVVIAENKDVGLWLGTQSGWLLRYDPQQDSLIKVQRLPEIHDLAAYGNELWIAGNTVYSFRWNSEAGRLTKGQTFPQPPAQLTTIELDLRGNVYLGLAEKGLYYLDRRAGTRGEYKQVFGNNDPNRVDVLPFKNIYELVFGEDELWVCAAEGLGLLQQRYFETANALPGGNTNTVVLTQQGEAFVSFGDWYQVSPTQFGFEGMVLPELNAGSITGLGYTSQYLYAGTSTGMLLKTNLRGDLLASHDLTKRGEGIFSLFADRQNRIWFCQAPSLQPIVGVACLLPDGKIKTYANEAGLEKRILVLKAGPDGRIYAGGTGAQSYLYRYEPDTDRFLNLSLPFNFYVNPNFEVHDLAIDQEGIIWLATTDGLLRHDLDRIRKIDLGEAYEDTEIRGMAVSANGGLWLATDTKGLLFYRKGKTVLFGEQSGLPSRVMTYRCLAVDEFDRLWAGTSEGLVYSRAENPRVLASPAPVLYRYKINEVPVQKARVLVHREDVLDLDITSPNLSGFRMYYQHQLDNGPWSNPSTNATIRLSNLPLGKHELTVRARREDGYDWSPLTVIPVRVHRYWYQRPIYGWGLALGLFLALGWWFFWRKRLDERRINRLSDALRMERNESKKATANLAAARATILEDNREKRDILFELAQLRNMVEGIQNGMKWEGMLAVLFNEWLKLDGVAAFEIAVRHRQYVWIDSGVKGDTGIKTQRILYDAKLSFPSWCLNQFRPTLFGDLTKISRRLPQREDPRLRIYQSAVYVPFHVDNKKAVLILYSGQRQGIGNYDKKMASILAAHLDNCYFEG